MPHEQLTPIPIPDTAFALAGRLSLERVGAQRAAFLSDPLGRTMLEAMSVPGAVLNSHRQIVVANRAFLDLFGLVEIDAALALRPGEVRFSVHNSGAMAPGVRLQIFQRSFSTKRGEGRGVGTYGVKLFGERYLGAAWRSPAASAAGRSR